MPEHSPVVPASAQVAVFDAANGPFRLARYPLRPVEDTEVLVRVRMSTICRSDIHSWQGKRPSPCPGLLGHEIVGTIVALGAAITHDMREAPLAVGDRLTWPARYSACGECYYCKWLPSNSGVRFCKNAKAYGFVTSDTPPHLLGGWAEKIVLQPGTWSYRVPDELTDEQASECAPKNLLRMNEEKGISEIENLSSPTHKSLETRLPGHIKELVNKQMERKRVCGCVGVWVCEREREREREKEI